MDKSNKILIVDDSEINRSLLADMLSADYSLLEASNGLEAMVLINQYHSELSMVLLDIVMPEMDGFEVLASMNGAGLLERLPVIMISAETSSAYIDHAYELGAAEYISRPFDEQTVKRRVKNTITLYSKQKTLENLVTEQILEKEKSNLVMIEILSHIVEFRNGESGLHVLHIRIITEALLKQLAKRTNRYNLNAKQINLISNVSALHDIGKISIPEEILNKPGRLTPEEYEIIKTHSVIGAEMLENVPYYQDEELVRMARDICRWHHERYDGSGYPDGLKGDDIPISAQVVALADVYDALTSRRVYKPAYSHEEALRMIMDGECGAFSPLLLECLRSVKPYLERELHVRSAGGISKMELQDMTRSLIQSSNASNRTLALLEQERTKYQFFASMSKEIQFEYSGSSDVLTVSDWGAEQLGVSSVLVHPGRNEEIYKIFTREDFVDLRNRLSSAKPEDPIVTCTYRINVQGSPRWCKVIARLLWVMEETNELTGMIGKLIDIHEEHIELDRLKQIARYDSLTGLYNRAYACKAIEETLKESRAENRKFALLLLDLDYFKNANDQYGHQFGDRVLEEVAIKVRNSVRANDICARIGGDEFLIFMEYKDNIELLVDRVYQAIGGRYENFVIAASMGVALAPENGMGYDLLFLHADKALYAAKKNGRSHYCFYDDSMQDLLSVLSRVDDVDSEAGRR